MATSENTKYREQQLIKGMREGMDCWLLRISPALKTPGLLGAMAKIRGWIDYWERELDGELLVCLNEKER